MNRQRQLRRSRERKARCRRRHVRGCAERPRLTVFRSHRQIYCQVVDDEQGRTLCAASSIKLDDSAGAESAAKDSAKDSAEDSKGKKALAEAVGSEIARRLLEKGIDRVVFDRGWYRYHGRVRALADSARKAGLKF